MENNNITAEKQKHNKQVADEVKEFISFGELTEVLDDVCYNLSIAAIDINEEMCGEIRNQIWYVRLLRDMFKKMKD